MGPSPELAAAQAELAELRAAVDVAVMFDELENLTMASLAREIAQCGEELGRLQFTVPVASDMDVFEVVARMKGEAALTMPAFGESDDVYERFGRLERRLEPLAVSVEFLPLRVAELVARCPRGTFAEGVEDLQHRFGELSRRWRRLCDDLAAAQATIAARWTQVWAYVVQQLADVVETLELEFSRSQRISNSLSANHKLCANAITVIEKARDKALLKDAAVLAQFNSRLLPAWRRLNSSLAHKKHQPEGLRPFHATKRLSRPQGLGIDLGLGVEAARDPFSIVKTDRVQDLGEVRSTRPALLEHLERVGSDDATLVHETLDSLSSRVQRLHIDWRHLKAPRPGYTCKIPVIEANYVSRGLPTIKKKFQDRPTRIPNISFNHPVFNSPQSPFKKISSQSLGLQSPVRFQQVQLSPTPKSGYADDSDLRRTRSRASSQFRSPLNLGTAPSLGTTPNLTYYSPSSYRSTSPHRPTSSLGSRFDDEHLLQPLKLRHEKRSYYT